MSKNQENPSIFDTSTPAPVEKFYVGGKTIESLMHGSHIIVLQEEPLKNNAAPLHGIISYTKEVGKQASDSFVITRNINGSQSQRHMQFEDGAISLLHKGPELDNVYANIDMQTGMVFDYQVHLTEGIEKKVPAEICSEKLNNILVTAELIIANKPYYSFSDLKRIVNCFETLGIPCPSETSVSSS